MPFFSFFFFFFFFYFFGCWRWRNVVGEERRCGVGESRRSPVLGKKKREPRALETQPKTTSFWVGLNFF